MACSNYWSSPFQVGSHHLARSFMKAGWDVAYFSDPISPLHVFAGSKHDLKARFDSYKNFGAPGREAHVREHVPGAIFTPHNKFLLRSRWVYNNWWTLTVPSVKKISQRMGFAEVDLIYIDSIIHAFWLKVVKYKKSIFRLADNNSGFDRFNPSAGALSEYLGKNVDLVVYSAKSLKDYALSLKPQNIHYLPNGINLGHFLESPRNIPEDLKSIPKPIAIYVGAMDSWFDFDLMNLAVEKLPQVNFVVIGPKGLASSKLNPRPNLHLLGTKSYFDLPPYLHNADVGIIPFNVRKYPVLVNNINPLKMYEYLACGLGVVSVSWEELKNLNMPAELCDTAEEFVRAISRKISAPRTANDEVLSSLAKMDWDQRVQDILAALHSIKI